MAEVLDSYMGFAVIPSRKLCDTHAMHRHEYLSG